MTIKTPNRLDRLESTREAREWGEAAAVFNEGIKHVLWPAGSYLWRVALEAHRRTLERLAQEEAK